MSCWAVKTYPSNSKAKSNQSANSATHSPTKGSNAEWPGDAIFDCWRWTWAQSSLCCLYSSAKSFWFISFDFYRRKHTDKAKGHYNGADGVQETANSSDTSASCHSMWYVKTMHCCRCYLLLGCTSWHVRLRGHFATLLFLSSVGDYGLLTNGLQLDASFSHT